MSYSKLSGAYIKEDFVNNQELRSNLNPAYCLTVEKSTSAPYLKPCDDTISQKFTYDPNTQQIKSISNNYCLNTSGSANGTQVIRVTCDSTQTQAGQKWMYDAPSKSIVSLIAPSRNLKSINNVIQLSTPSPTPSQVWFPSNNCTLSPSNALFSPCSATQCGTNGTQTRPKYTVTSPSSGLGNCLNQNDIETAPCSAVPCPVDCTLTPSNALFSPCSATQCGTNGTRTRPKYSVLSPSMYNGKCPNQNDVETTPCSAVPCPVDCTLSPSNALFSPCSATQCGTNGTQTRPKYIVSTPSVGLGSCPNESEEEIISCSADPCPVDCVLSPSPSTVLFSPCSATECGTTGTQTRPKYKLDSPAMYGGTCDKENEMETVNCSAVSCAPEPSPSTKTDSFIEKYKWQMVGGIVLFILLIIIILVVKK